MRLAAVLAVLLGVVLAPVASAAPGVRVSINGADGVFIPAAELNAAVDSSSGDKATLRESDGRTETPLHGGVSLRKLINNLVGIPVEFVEAVEVTRPSQPGTIRIEGDEVRDGFTGDPLGGPPRDARVDARSGSSVRFFRPMRSEDDANARDVVDTAGDNELQMAVETDGVVRTVTASVDDEEPEPGVGVGFNATVEDTGGASFTYRWDFDDGTTAQGQNPSHDFVPGNYQVQVLARGSDGSAGVATVELFVRGPEPSATPTGSPPPGGESGPGPDGGGGPGAGGPAPTGGGTGTEDDRASGPQDTAGKGEEREGGRKPAAPRESPTPRPDRKADATPTPEASATPTASAGPAAGTTPAPSPTPTATPAQDEKGKDPRAPEPEPGAKVNGTLLASAGEVAQVQEAPERLPETDPQERDRTRAGGGGGDSILGWVAGGAGFLLLLGSGAARESSVRLRVPWG